MIDQTKIKVTKLEAARLQLATAIELWFLGGDVVSTHTLAYAAYEIIEVRSKRIKPDRRTLIFDSAAIKEDQKADFHKMMRQHANFFKHGDRPEEETIFFPALTEAFLMFAVLGVADCNLQHTRQELIFLFWIHVHRPESLNDLGRKLVDQHLSVERLAELRATPKKEFYNLYLGALT